MKPGCRIDQLLAGCADGDAISQEAFALQAAFRRLGYVSELFAVPEHVSPTLRDRVRPLAECPAGPGDAVVHHYSIGSPAVQAFAASRARRILIYHNITPPEFFRGFDDRVAVQLERGRAELRAVGQSVDAIWADSDFNARELRDLGLQQARVFQLPFDRAVLDLPPDPNVLGKFTARLSTVLFVGRIAPNKRVEEAIEAFYWYHKTENPFSRLVIVGSERSCPRYSAMLRMQVGDLDLPNVCFEGFASPAGLPAYYRTADVFLSTSAHEGYCLPLVEAMYMGVPVVARSTGGTPEAMGGAGVLYEGLTPCELAGVLGRVIRDQGLRREILDGQAARVRAVLGRDLDGELRELLGALGP